VDLTATLRLHDSHATAVAWRPDGSLVTAGLDGHLRTVSPEFSPAPPGTPQGKGLCCLALDPEDPSRAVTGDLEGALALWDVDARAAAPPIQGHEGTAYGAVWTGPGGLVTAGTDGVVRRWERPGASLAPDRIFGTGAPGEHVRWLAADAGGVVLAAAGAGGPLRLWTLDRCHEWGDLGRAVAGLAVHPGGHEVAAVSFAGHVEVRQVPTGEVLRSSPAEYEQAVCPLAYSGDGAWLAVGGDGRVRLLDADSLEVRAEDRFPGEAQDLAFDPTGARLAVAATDGRVRVYEL
jgi:WD40 repeat protein